MPVHIPTRGELRRRQVVRRGNAESEKPAGAVHLWIGSLKFDPGGMVLNFDRMGHQRIHAISTRIWAPKTTHVQASGTRSELDAGTMDMDAHHKHFFVFPIARDRDHQPASWHERDLGKG